MSRPLMNKNRMLYTRILMVLTLLAGVFSTTVIRGTVWPRESVIFVGYLLAAACAIGRIYSSAFIGGLKSEQLITYGPYSACRNPLYFFSLLGAAGIGLMTTSLVAFAVIFFGFLGIYVQLIKREEDFLSEKFGQQYRDYVARVPRLLPSLKNYTCPDEIPFQPKYLTKAVADAIWWFVPLPLFQLAELLQKENLITPVMRLF